MNGNYEKILDRVSRVSGIEREELERRVEMKRMKLSGLISREGSLQIIAAELGISFENEKLKINELLPGMRRINVSGKIISLSPVRIFKTKRGDEGKVVNLLVADETSNIKVVLWDTNHISLIEKGEIGEGIVVELFGGSMRENELHMGSFSELKISDEVFDKVKVERMVKEKEIFNFVVGESVKTRAFIVQVFDPRFFEVDKETGKKVPEGLEVPKDRMVKKPIVNIVLDDGTENIRAVLFQEALEKIGLGELNETTEMGWQKEKLLGKEMVFIGNIRKNTYFNTPEFYLEDILELDLDSLISSFESS